MRNDPDWHRYRPVVPDGAHLAYSKDTNGAYRALLFDNKSNTLLGPPELVEIDDEDDYDSDEDDSDALPSDADALAFLIVVGIAVGVGVIKATPHVIRWWQRDAIPGARRWREFLSQRTRLWSETTVERVKSLRDTARAQLDKIRPGSSAQPEPPTHDTPVESAPTEVAISSRTAESDFLRVVDLTLDEARTSMSSEEAQRRLLAVLAAAAFIAEQMRVLSSARIQGVPETSELRGAIAKLTDQSVTDVANRVLESKPKLLSAEGSAEFERVFGGGVIVDGQYRPLSNESMRRALSLPTIG